MGLPSPSLPTLQFSYGFCCTHSLHERLFLVRTYAAPPATRNLYLRFNDPPAQFGDLSGP